MREEPCRYCQGPTESASNDHGTAYHNHCKKCEVYFNYAIVIKEDEVIDYHCDTAIFFKIKDKQFVCQLFHLANRVKVWQCGQLENIIDAKTIPNWTPSNIQEKISKLLIFW